MSSPIIASPALSDSIVLVGGVTAGSMPLSYLQTDQPSDRTRFTDLSVLYAPGGGSAVASSGAYVVLDFGTPVALHLHYFGMTNASTFAAIRKRGGNNPDPTISPVYDTVIGLGTGSAHDIPLAPVDGLKAVGISKIPHIDFSSAGFGGSSFRYWRFDFIDPDNPDGYLDIGRMILASFSSINGAPPSCYQFPRGVSASNSSIGFNEPTVRLETAGRQTYSAVRTPLDQQKFSIAAVKESDLLGSLRAIRATRGNSRGVLWIENPADPAVIAQKTVYGLMTINDSPHLGLMAVGGVVVFAPYTQVYTVDGSIVAMN